MCTYLFSNVSVVCVFAFCTKKKMISFICERINLQLIALRARSKSRHYTFKKMSKKQTWKYWVRLTRCSICTQCVHIMLQPPRNNCARQTIKRPQRLGPFCMSCANILHRFFFVFHLLISLFRRRKAHVNLVVSTS